MSNEKRQEHFQSYKPEEPVDKETIQRDQQEIREAAKHAAQEMAAEELGDDDTKVTKKQAEKEIRHAAKKAQQEEHKKK